MASFGNQLSFFFLLVLVISPQIHAREGKFFSLFTHFRTIYNVKDPLAKSPTLAPEPAPEPTTAPGPAPELVTEPTQTPTPASAPGPSNSQAIGSTIPSGPAPEPEFFESGDGYGLYGRGSYSQYSPTKETPTTTTTTTTTFGNELLNEDFSDESHETGYPKTNFYNNNEEYRNNDNTNEEYRKSYSKNYVDNYSNNNNDKENYYYYNNNNNNNNNYYSSNGYQGQREGMSDTRFMKNGKYFYDINSHNENYNLNEFESGRGGTENEVYYEKNQYPNEFDTMEEYERQQEQQGYTP